MTLMDFVSFDDKYTTVDELVLKLPGVDKAKYYSDDEYKITQLKEYCYRSHDDAEFYKRRCYENKQESDSKIKLYKGITLISLTSMLFFGIKLRCKK